MISPENENSITLLKYRDKLRSSYFSKEKLLEFYKKELPKEDMQIIESELSQSLTMRQELEDLIQGEKFIESLKGIELTDLMKTRVQQAQPQPMAIDFSKRLDLSQWSPGVRRSAMVIAGALAVVIVVLMVPWVELYEQALKKQSSQVVLVETSRVKTELDLTTFEQQEKPEFSDEKDGVPVEGEKAKDNQVVASTPPPQTTPTPPTQLPQVDVQPDPVPAKIVQSAPKSDVKQAPIVGSAPVPSKGPESTSSASASTIGYLYRGRFAVSNLTDTEPKITEKIKELGGRKAGEVALGWKKTPQLAYYHFTIPENKLGELNQVLSLYGKPGIIKERHPRVMPDGIIRLIVEIEEAKP